MNEFNPDDPFTLPTGDVPARKKPAVPVPTDGYDVAPFDDPEDETPVPPVARPARAPKTSEAPAPKPAAPPRDAEEAVDQVWTRGAEWSGSVTQLVIVGIATFCLAYALVSYESYTLAFLALVVGGFGFLALSYPILITLERPVRITPEQAVRDYYSALSHHFPHHKRMWLLLARPGKFCGSYGSYEGFRSYWTTRLAELRKAGGASGFTPLKFTVQDFRSDKSAGKSEITVKYTVAVSVRGKQTAGPFETIKVEADLVKGPDRMWYLERGTLP